MLLSKPALVDTKVKKSLGDDDQRACTVHTPSIGRHKCSDVIYHSFIHVQQIHPVARIIITSVVKFPTLAVVALMSHERRSDAYAGVCMYST